MTPKIFHEKITTKFKNRRKCYEKSENTKSDLEDCRDKINELLREYNCSLMSADEWSAVLIMDNDTYETKGDLR